MLLPHNKVSGGVQDSQIMIPSFFDRFYVMPPLTNGVHYNIDVTNDARSQVPRESYAYKHAFKQRTEVERYFSRMGGSRG